MFLVSISSKSITPKINGVTGEFARSSSFFFFLSLPQMGGSHFYNSFFPRNGTRISSFVGNPATSDQKYPSLSALVCSVQDVGILPLFRISSLPLGLDFPTRVYMYIFAALETSCNTFGTFLRIPFRRKCQRSLIPHLKSKTFTSNLFPVEGEFLH